MASWGTPDVAQASPAAAPVPATPAEDAGAGPRARGWVQPEAYNYARYSQASRDDPDAVAAFEAAAANNQGGYAHNAPIYEWKGEYGDVGPRFLDIEAMLFGDEESHTGVIDFAKYVHNSPLNPTAFRSC